MSELIVIAGKPFNYFEREEWGSLDTDRPDDALSGDPEPMGFLHHQGASHNNPTIVRPLSIQEEMAMMRAWQKWCIEEAREPWSDIPYNIGVFPFSGNVYEARGWRYKSGSTRYQNDDSKSVCILGNIVPGAPGMTVAIDIAASVFVWGVALGELVRKPKIFGHWENPKDFKGTTCPGIVDLNAFRADFETKLEKHFNPVIDPENPEGDEMKHLIRVRFRGYWNVFLVGNYPLHLTPETNQYYINLNIPEIVCEPHDQSIDSLLYACGLTRASLVQNGGV